MACPNCKIELECPCRNCQEWRERGGEVAALVEEWVDGNTIRCPICGFTHNANFWEAHEFHLYDKERGDLYPEAEKQIEQEIQKWRENND